jgi:tetratricopeptide (TPR) repeat protein
MRRFIIAYILILFSAGLFAQEGILEKFIEKPVGDTAEKQRLEYTFYLSEAAKQKMLGNFTLAKDYYGRCLEIRPERPTPYYEMASILFVEGETDRARGYVDQAMEFEPSNEWFKYLAIQIATEQERYLDAATYYHDLIMLFPERTEFHKGEIDMLIRGGDNKTALKRLDEVEDKFGYTKYTAIRKKEIYLSEGNDKKAFREMEKLIDKYPDDVEMMGILAELYAEKGEQDKALALYEKMKGLNSGNPLVYFSLGKYYYDLGRKEEAINEFQTGFSSKEVAPELKIQVFLDLVRSQGNNDQLNDNLAGLLGVLYDTDKGNPAVDGLYADYLYNTGKHEESEVIYRRLVKSSPSNYLAWQNLLFIQNEKEDFNEIYTIASEAVSNFPNQPLFLLFKGLGASQTGRAEEAVSALNRGLSINVNNAELTKQFYITLGEAYYKMNNYKDAFMSFDNVLALEPDNALVLNNYSYYLSLLGQNLDKALMMIEKCIALEPDNPTYLDTYAWVLFKMGDFAKALEKIEKVIKLDPDPSGEVLEHYGDILYKNNMSEVAKEAWRKAKATGEASDQIDSKIEAGLK